MFLGIAVTKIFCNLRGNYKKEGLFHILSFCLFVFFAFCYGIYYYAIVDMNEGLYAEVAREMLVLKNYVIPHLNYVPYLEKPPGFYWLLSLSYKIFGVTAFSARLIPSAASVFLSCSIVWFLHKVKKELCLGWITVLILSSSFGYILISRVVFFDGLLTALVSSALFCFYLWYQEEKKIFLRFFYVLLACAFLTKGMLALVIVFPISVLLLLFTGKIRRIFANFDAIGVSLFFLLIIPWHIFAAVRLPEFTWDYFVNEQWYRFLNKRIPHDYHTGAIYFYIPRVFAYLAPWSALVPTLFKRWRGKIAKQDPLKIFCWIWFSWALLVFSLSGAKGDYYMVLGTPPLAILLACKIREYFQSNRKNILNAIFIGYFLLLLGVIFYVLKYNLMQPSMLQHLKVLLLFFIVYFLVGIILFWYYRKPQLSFIFIAGFIIPLMLFYANFQHAMQDYYSQISLTEYINQHDAERDVYLFQDYEEISSALFYLQKRAYVVDSKSRDLYFGATTPAARGWFLNDKEFLARVDAQPSYIVVRKNKLEALQNALKPRKFYQCATTVKAVLVSDRC